MDPKFIQNFDFIQQLMQLLQSPEQSNYTDPSTTLAYARPLPEQFNTVDPGSQTTYLQHMSQAPNQAFSALWPEQVQSPQGITLELIQSLLQPYKDIQQTGLPQ